MTEPCLCGADDFRFCHPNNFDSNGRYIDREATADHEARELLDLRLDTLERVIEELQARCEDKDADVLQGIYEHLQQEVK